MNEPSKLEIILKVQKLRRLETSSNLNESAAAKKKVDELIKRYNLSESDLFTFSKQWQIDILSVFEIYHYPERQTLELMQLISKHVDESEWNDEQPYYDGIYNRIKEFFVDRYGDKLFEESTIIEMDSEDFESANEAYWKGYDEIDEILYKHAENYYKRDY